MQQGWVVDSEQVLFAFGIEERNRSVNLQLYYWCFRRQICGTALDPSHSVYLDCYLRQNLICSLFIVAVYTVQENVHVRVGKGQPYCVRAEKDSACHWKYALNKNPHSFEGHYLQIVKRVGLHAEIIYKAVQLATHQTVIQRLFDLDELLTVLFASLASSSTLLLLFRTHFFLVEKGWVRGLLILCYRSTYLILLTVFLSNFILLIHVFSPTLLRRSSSCRGHSHPIFGSTSLLLRSFLFRLNHFLRFISIFFHLQIFYLLIIS